MFINTLQQAKERYDNYINLAESERITVQEKLATLFTALLPNYVIVVHLHSDKITVWGKGDVNWEKNQLVFTIYNYQLLLDNNSNFSMEEIGQVHSTLHKILFGK